MRYASMHECVYQQSLIPPCYETEASSMFARMGQPTHILRHGPLPGCKVTLEGLHPPLAKGTVLSIGITSHSQN